MLLFQVLCVSFLFLNERSCSSVLTFNLGDLMMKLGPNEMEVEKTLVEIHSLMPPDLSRTESIFEVIIPAIVSMKRISECGEYHLIMSALFDYIESSCISA